MAVKKHEDPEPTSGQLIGPKPPLPLATRTAKVKTLDRLLSMLSIWPFRNRAFAESLETATKVIKKQTELEETIITHGRTRGRLNDLAITLAQDRLQRRRGVIEGLNNKAKVTMRKSYGFRTFRILELALYHTLGKLPEPQLAHRFF